ncbi:hypothetical protein PG984_010017 [Apiospora sp. TS-2023a]
MEYQPTSTPSYPPQPSRPGPSPLGNGAAANAPALYATAPGAGGSANGYYSASAAAVAPTTGGGRLYSDNAVVQQLPPRISSDDRSIKSARTTCEFAAREYLTQLRKIGPGSGSSYGMNDPMARDAMNRARAQQELVLDELQTLRRSLAVVIKEAEAQRWRKWMLGGMLASIIPLVRRIFRRPSKDNSNMKGENRPNNNTNTKLMSGKESPGGNNNNNSNALMNATEYAFGKSRALIQRIRASVRGHGWFLGGFAAVSFFVLSVLYVFENEVSLRVAKTVSKRLKRLTAKVERGGRRYCGGTAARGEGFGGVAAGVAVEGVDLEQLKGFFGWLGDGENATDKTF